MTNSAITTCTAPRDRFLKFCIHFLSAALMIFFPLSASALMLGEPAPGLHVEKWIKGEPVAGYRPGNIYLIEFWSTRCPHCRESIPLLSDLQTSLAEKGLIIVSISTESEEDLTAYVNENDADIQYRIALDRERQTRNGFMGGFGVEGVPHAFIVDTAGRVVWQGHPLDNMAEALEKIVAGEYDLAAAVAEEQAEVLMEVYLYLALRTNEKAIANGIGQRMLDYATANPALLTQMTRFILKGEHLMIRDFEMALRAISRADEITKGKDVTVSGMHAAVLHKLGREKEAEAILIKLKREIPSPADNSEAKAGENDGDG